MKKLNNQKHFYYERFVNENNIRSIPEFTIRQHFWVYYFSFYLFSCAIPTIFTFVGFNFDNLFAVFIFGWNIFLLFWLIYFCIKFNAICKQYNVFKKNYYSYVFCILPIVLCFVFSILPIWTAKNVVIDDKGSFAVNFNPGFYLFICLPIFLGYLIYCYYAFMKCFAKYANKKTKYIN